MTPAQAVTSGVYDPGSSNRGSSFIRSLVTANNQVPMWGYLALGVVFGGVAWYGYYEANKGKS